MMDDELQRKLDFQLQLLAEYEEKHDLEDDPRARRRLHGEIVDIKTMIDGLRSQLEKLGASVAEPVRPLADQKAAAVNPFHVGGRLPEASMFFGRERLVREVRNELRKYANVSIVGEPRAGKSSLLHYLKDTAHEWCPRVRIEYFDVQWMADEGHFCEEVCARLGSEGNSLSDLSKALRQFSGIMMFDEIDLLAESDFSPRLQNFLRAAAQKPDFALCLATEHSIGEIFSKPERVSPLANIFTVKEIAPLDEGEAHRFLEGRLAGNGIVFTPAERAHVVRQSKGQIADLQKLAKGLYDEKLYG